MTQTTQCNYQKTINPCQTPAHLIAWTCPRCQNNGTLTLCTTHWDLYQWTLTEHLGANCPQCWNPIHAAHTPITGGTITYYGEP